MADQVPVIVQQLISAIRLECPVCFDSTNVELKFFPCQHHACTHCIDRITTRYRSFPCSICRENIQPPAGGLPTYRYGMKVNNCIAEMEKRLRDLPIARENEREMIQPFQDSDDTEENARGLFSWLCIGSEVQPEPTGAIEVRGLSRTHILEVQHPLLPSWLIRYWSIVMLITMLAGVVWPITLDCVDNGKPTCVVTVSCILSVVWFILVMWNFNDYRPTEHEPIKGEDNCISYFVLEQAQQILSELSLYPQLIFAATQLSFTSLTNAAIIPFVTLFCLLQVVYILRVYTVVQMKEYVRLYFDSLIFSLVSNSFCISFLLALIISLPGELHIWLSLLVLFNSVANQPMFYLSHLYEITLQSASNVVHIGTAISEIRVAKLVIQRLKGLETFHKNIYTMSLPTFESPFYFWIVPSTSFTVWVVLTYVQDPYVWVLVSVWFLFNSFINYKSFLFPCMIHYRVVVMIRCSVCWLAASPALWLTAITIFLIWMPKTVADVCIMFLYISPLVVVFLLHVWNKIGPLFLRVIFVILDYYPYLVLPILHVVAILSFIYVMHLTKHTILHICNAPH